MTTPTGKKPEDHKQSTAAAARDAALERDEILAGLPELTAPVNLAYRQRARVKEITALAAGNGSIADDDTTVEFDIKDPASRARLSAIYDVCGEVDEFAKSIAVDPAAWTRFSAPKDENFFFALLSLYNEAVGESNGS